jgi:predicted amidohydrolase YtcJ
MPNFAQDLADWILVGRSVLTMNDAQPRVEAIAVKDGLIIAVGSPDEVIKFKGDTTEVTEITFAAAKLGKCESR